MDSASAHAYFERLRTSPFQGYSFDSLLGFGKSAAVLKATSPSGLQCAVKVFDNELLDKYGREVQSTRILREVSLVGQAIPNLVKILDGGKAQEAGCEHFFVAMEYVEGQTLTAFISSNGPQSEDFTLAVFRTLREICDELLSRGLIHRDIKPDNILIGENQSITLMDLGVMKVLSADDLTDDSMSKPFLGTLRYAPPEFLLHEEESGTTDAWRAINLYQIGGVLHDLTMGRPLFAQYREPYARLVIAIQKEIPEVRRVDFTYSTQQMIRNLLTKDWRERKRLFESIDLNSLGKIVDESSGILDNIRKLTSEFAEKQQQMAADRAEAEAVQKEKSVLYSDLLLAIKDVFDDLLANGVAKEATILYTGSGDRHGRFSACLWQLNGSLVQGYSEPVYVVLKLGIGENKSVKIELVGIACAKRFGSTWPPNYFDAVSSLLAATGSMIVCLEGVYDREVLQATLRSKLLSVLQSALHYMASVVRQRLDFEAKAIGRTGPMVGFYSSPSERVINI